MRERPLSVNSALMVNTIPDKMKTVQKDINALKIAEVTSIIDDGRLAVVIHAGSMEEKKAIVKEIENIDGVLSVNLTYDHIEEDETDM